MKKYLIAFLTLLILPYPLLAATYTVCSEGCSETTIQAVFDNNHLGATEEDIIEVRENLTENIITWGSDDDGTADWYVILKSQDGQTYEIDGGNNGDSVITITGTSYFKIQNLKITGMSGSDRCGIDINTGCSEFVLSDLEIYGTDDSDIYGIGMRDDIVNGVIEDNVMYNLNKGVRAARNNGGVNDSPENILIQRNLIHDMIYGTSANSDGITFGGNYSMNNDGSIIQYNEVYNVDDQCVDLLWGSNITVRYNKLHDSDESIMKVTDQYTNTGIAVYGNLLYNAPWRGIGVGSAEVKVYNNTIYNVGIGIYQSSEDWPGDLYIYNNIISHVGYLTETYTAGCYQLMVSNIAEMDNNICYDFRYNTGKIDGAYKADWSTYIAYMQTEGFELSGLNSNPLFIDAGSGDFTLQAGSPAIDAGYDLGESYDDFLDPSSSWVDSVVLLDQDLFGAGYDIGAYVYNLFISSALPVNNDTGVSITIDLTWTNPTGTTNIDLLFDKDTNPPTTKELDDQSVETWDCGTLDENSDYYWRVDVNHAGGTKTGAVYKFTTTTASPTGLSNIGFSSNGANIGWALNGASINRN